MKHRSLTSLFVLFLLWFILASQVNNEIILPQPMDVIRYMGAQLCTAMFYQATFSTILRAIIGLLIAFITGLGCALISYRYRFFRDLFYPVLLLTRSVPNVCYIIMVQFWFGREVSSFIITFLILFPLMYANIFEGLQALPTTLLNVLKIYPEQVVYKLFHIYLPLLKSAVIASISSGLSLGFKVGVMAEILGQVQIGIGRQLNLCRLNFDMIGIFSWTAWIVLLLLVFELLFQRLLQHKKKMPE